MSHATCSVPFYTFRLLVVAWAPSLVCPAGLALPVAYTTAVASATPRLAPPWSATVRHRRHQSPKIRVNGQKCHEAWRVLGPRRSRSVPNTRAGHVARFRARSGPSAPPAARNRTSRAQNRPARAPVTGARGAAFRHRPRPRSPGPRARRRPRPIQSRNRKRTLETIEESQNIDSYRAPFRLDP